MLLSSLVAAKGAGGAAPPSAAHSPLPLPAYNQGPRYWRLFWAYTVPCHSKAQKDAVKVELHSCYDSCITTVC